MAVRLFDISNGEVIPSEHCYALKSLKDVMDYYKKDKQYLKVFKYLFYTHCPDGEANPCFHLHVDEKENFISREVSVDFSFDDEVFLLANEAVKKIYETELSRAYYGIKTAVDNMATVMMNEKPTFGRDGSASALLQIAKNFDDVRQSYKGVYKDLMEEQQTTVRGKQNLAYDQRGKKK